jgi:hypothetical protein
MGQPLNERQREALKRHPKVAIVTPKHVVLKNRTVLDPNEFAFLSVVVYVIRKLARCNCGEGHTPGTHVIIPLIQDRTVLGDLLVEEYGGEHPYCPNGQWTDEERLSEREARKLGLDRFAPKPERAFALPGGLKRMPPADEDIHFEWDFELEEADHKRLQEEEWTRQAIAQAEQMNARCRTN